MASTFELTVKCETWNHETRGLFDHESKNVFKKVYSASVTREGFVLSRHGSDVSMARSVSGPYDEAVELTQNASDQFDLFNSFSGSVGSIQQTKPLLSILWKDGAYWVAHPDCVSTSTSSVERVSSKGRRLWVMLKKGAPRLISENDLIKMGRCKIRVKDIVLDATARHPTSADAIPLASTVSGYDSDTSLDGPAEEGIDDTVNYSTDGRVRVDCCRICYEESERDNPLIAPCVCNGSMKHIHLKCLQHWMKGRMHVVRPAGGPSAPSLAAGNVTTYFWRSLDCELCKAPYPPTVKCPFNPNSDIDLYDMPRPLVPYIVLESNLNSDMPGNTSNNNSGGPPNRRASAPATTTQAPNPLAVQKGLHIISFNGPAINGAANKPRFLARVLRRNSTGSHVPNSLFGFVKIGRGHDADVRLSDISVSRHHALIRVHHGSRFEKKENSLRSNKVVDDTGSESNAENVVNSDRNFTGLSSKGKEPYYFTVEDLGSKFGSLIGVSDAMIRLDPSSGSSVTIQSGRTLITVELRKPRLSALNCFGGKVSGTISLVSVQNPATSKDQFEKKPEDRLVDLLHRFETHTDLDGFVASRVRMSLTSTVGGSIVDDSYDQFEQPAAAH